MNPYVMDGSSAADYVRALFRYVLDRKSTSEDEISHWTNEVLIRGPAEVLRLFTESEENQLRLHAAFGHSTEFPHGHFYSPVVNVEEVTSQSARIFSGHAPSCVELDAERQLSLLVQMSRFFKEMPFSEEKNALHRYYYNNTSYGFGDACVYWGIIGINRPQRIIEIGSGFTSALALDAIDHFGLSTTHCTFIDPHPELLLQVASPINPRHNVIVDMVQNIDPNIVSDLSENDILFVDSSHVVKTGSDVHFELTQLLPRVKSGVIVHFHDTFYPFEYPHGWVVETNHSWNEIYFLHTFLMYNTDFEVLYFNDFVAKQHANRLRTFISAETASRIELNPGGGLWLRRK